MDHDVSQPPRPRLSSARERNGSSGAQNAGEFGKSTNVTLIKGDFPNEPRECWRGEGGGRLLKHLTAPFLLSGRDCDVKV